MLERWYAAAISLSVGDKLKAVGDWLVALGPLGLFGMSLLDSALVPLPGGPDLAVIVLSARRHALMPAYVLAAAGGSALGCTIMYLIARRIGAAALRRVKPERRESIENLLGRYDVLAIAVPAVLPPPFPFKPFVLCAGVFKVQTARFIAAISVGRTVRFLIEGWLAVRFGEQATQIIKNNAIAVLIAVVILFVTLFALERFRRKKNKERSRGIGETGPSVHP